jgi:hypothetical protein
MVIPGRQHTVQHAGPYTWKIGNIICPVHCRLIGLFIRRICIVVNLIRRQFFRRFHNRGLLFLLRLTILRANIMLFCFSPTAFLEFITRQHVLSRLLFITPASFFGFITRQHALLTLTCSER